jgi:serine/threonine-protein kinase
VLTAGDVLADRYRLDEPIATGGMGEVWRATDVTLGRAVAVKVLRASLLPDAAFDARFRAEARTLAALSHPNVVNIYDYGHSPVPDGDAVFLVMAHVDGQPLSARIAATGGLPVGETLAVLAQAADALHAAHGNGIVHRDVKPANLLVRPDGTVVLVDFGVARSPALTSASTGNQVLGTALYMAPEQASGRPVSPATDIYALGAVGYHCLVGHPPFVGESPIEVALRHVSEQPPPLPPRVPRAVRTLVMRALAKDPADRFPDAAAFAAAARAAAVRTAAMRDGAVRGGAADAGPTTVGAAAPVALPLDTAASDPPTLTELGGAPPPSGGPDGTARRDGRRRRLAALAGVLAMVVLLGIVGLLLLDSGRHGGSAPADRPASARPGSPAASPQPSSRRPRPTVTPTATPAAPGSAPGAPAGATGSAAPPSAQPTPSAGTTSGGAGDGGSGGGPSAPATSPPASAAAGGTIATGPPSAGPLPASVP